MFVSKSFLTRNVCDSRRMFFFRVLRSMRLKSNVPAFETLDFKRAKPKSEKQIGRSQGVKASRKNRLG